MMMAVRRLELAACLQVLALADIGVGEADKVQLHGLVHALTVGPGQLAQIDFDANYIGEKHWCHACLTECLCGSAT
jgi:hypothetical protein